MKKNENNCVGCDYCICCGRRHEEVLYCDECGDISDKLYEYFGKELCENCLNKNNIETN